MLFYFIHKPIRYDNNVPIHLRMQVKEITHDHGAPRSLIVAQDREDADTYQGVDEASDSCAATLDEVQLAYRKRPLQMRRPS